jgi:hypothetical protein
VTIKFGIDLSGVKVVAGAIRSAGKHAKEMESDLKKAMEAALISSKQAGKLKNVRAGLDPGRGDFTITAEFVLDDEGAAFFNRLVGAPEPITPADLAAADKAFADE